MECNCNVTAIFLIPRAPVIVSKKEREIEREREKKKEREREREQTEWTQTDLGVMWD